MTAEPSWGRPVRLAGGHLTHFAGADHRGSTRLAHDDWAWTDTLREPFEHGNECRRCLRRIPELARSVQRWAEIEAESGPWPPGTGERMTA